MGIFDFFKRKKDIEENIDLEEALNIKEIKEEDNTIIKEQDGINVIPEYEVVKAQLELEGGF